MPMNSGAPATPALTATKVKFIYSYKNCVFEFLFYSFLQDATGRLKIVVALYPFKAIEAGDLSLEKVINSINSSSLFSRDRENNFILFFIIECRI